MRKVLRRLRGLLGVGATWGTLWGVIGAGIGFLLGVANPSLWTLENPVTVWGLGMAAVPLLFVGFFEAGTTIADVVGAMGVTAMLGGTFAPGAVAIARRAELAAPEDGRLLEEGSG